MLHMEATYLRVYHCTALGSAKAKENTNGVLERINIKCNQYSP